MEGSFGYAPPGPEIDLAASERAIRETVDRCRTQIAECSASLR